MKIFSSSPNTRWHGKNFALGKRSLVLKSMSYVSHEISVPKSDKISISVVAKRRTGSGLLNISISNKKSTIFSETKIIRSSSSMEYKFQFSNTTKFSDFILNISRPKGSTGSIEVRSVNITYPFNKTFSPEKKSVTDNISSPGVKKWEPSDDLFLKYRNKKERIAFLVPYSIYGGAEVYIKNIIYKLNKDIFDISIVFLKNNKLYFLLEDKNISKYSIKSDNHLNVHLTSQKYDHIVYYNSVKIYNRLVGMKKSGLIPSKLHEIYHSDFYWPDSLCLLKSREMISNLFTISPSLCEDVSIPDQAKRVVAPVGIELDRFRSGDSEFFTKNFLDKDPDMKDMFLSGKRKNIVSVSRLSKEKNISYVLDIANSVPHFNFFIVGEGNMLNSLKKKADSLSLKNIFFLGFIKDVSLILPLFDAFLLTSSCNEGTPISILESMASEVPVFTTIVGKIGDVITDEKTGFSLSGDIDIDSKKIKRLVSSRSSMQDVVCSALDFVSGNHNSIHISSLFSENILDEFSSDFLILNDNDKDKVLKGYYV